MPGAEAQGKGVPGLQVERFVTGPLDNNVYLLTVDGHREAIAVDPALGAAEVVLPALRERELRLILIFATHAHWDHVAEVQALVEVTGATVAAHRLDAELIARPAHPMLFPDLVVPPADVGRELFEGDTVELGSVELKVLHTPGHSPGSICLYAAAESTLISGDTLFAGGIGRTDLPGGNAGLLRTSLQRLAQLPPETRVLPGHGEPTTIGEEAWLRRNMR
jgi:glyoxylase-like metal-dependent hydrolase (beta-lactamase superfamily II)